MIRYKTLIIYCLVFLISPWFLLLTLSRFRVTSFALVRPHFSLLIDKLTYFTHEDFLFINGDGREGHQTGDHGQLLPSFLPLILLGSYQLICERKKIWLLAWLIVGLLIALLFAPLPDYAASLWYLPPLTLIAAEGLLYSLSRRRFFIYFLLAWIFYESLRLYQILLVHRPFIAL